MTFTVAYLICILWIVASGVIQKRRIYWLIAFVPIIVLSYLAYSDGSSYFDILRFNQYLDAIRGLNQQYGAFGGLQRLIAAVPLLNLDSFGRGNLLMYSSQPFVELYCWFFSLFPVNGVLRAGTAIFFSGCLYLIVSNAPGVEEHGEDSVPYASTVVISISLAIFYLYFNYFFLLEGIRNFLAYAIVIAAFFSEKRLSRFAILCMYIVGVLIHPAAAVIVLLRILIKVPSLLAKQIIVLALLSWSMLQVLVVAVIKGIATIIPAFAIAPAYMSTAGAEIIGEVSIFEVLTTTLLLIAAIAIFLYDTAYLHIRFSSKYRWMMLMLIAFTIGAFRNPQFYLRSVVAVWIMTIPALTLFVERGFFGKKGHAADDTGDVLLHTRGVLFIGSLCMVGALVFFAWYKMTYSKGLFI